MLASFFIFYFMTVEEIYTLYTQHFLVDTDTRKIRKNTIFFALKGDNFNGNTFAKEALEKGAIYSIVDQNTFVDDDRIILVDNVLETLQKLANIHRHKLNIPIIALTGSNGKTTTKELINIVLSKQFKTKATFGNLNNHIGVPLTLLSMTKDTELGIVEMGANNPNEIAFLSNIAEPDYGYITNFGKAHLEGFGSIEGVIKAKCELYNYLIATNKTIFVNPSNTIQINKTKDANTILFEESIEFLEINPFVKVRYKNTEIQSNLVGKYNFDNIAVAITIGNYFGISVQKIKTALENYIPNNNRSQVITTERNKIILDAYNANPTSMKLAIENFDLIASDKNKTVILGDMFELGEKSSAEHQLIVDTVSSYVFDNVYLVGENFYKTTTKYPKFKTLEVFKEYLKDNLIEDNYILIKGSRGMALEGVMDFI